MSAKFTLNLAAFGRIKQEIAKPMAVAGAVVVRDEIRSQMDPGPVRTGHTYLVPSTKTPYVASAPGEPPAVREKDYRDSWQNTPAIEEGGKVVAYAFSDLQEEDGTYRGLNLEHGTTRFASSAAPDSMIVPAVQHILPRPHIGPGIAAAVPRIKALVAEASGK